MLKAIQLIYNFKEYLILMITIVISVILIYSNDNPQLENIRATSIAIVGLAVEKLSWIPNLKNLYLENRLLRERNLQLSIENNRYKEAMLENIRLRRLLTFKSETNIPFVAAEIVGKNSEQVVNSIVLNMGKTQHVKKNMPIVTDKGLVGKIIQVHDHYSLAQLLLDINFRLSIKIQRTRTTGIAAWLYGDVCELQGIPKMLDIKVGDVIITSGYGLFPEGIKVGVVTDISSDLPGMFKKVLFEPYVDFHKLEEVFVLFTEPPDYNFSQENK